MQDIQIKTLRSYVPTTFHTPIVQHSDLVIALLLARTFQ